MALIIGKRGPGRGRGQRMARRPRGDEKIYMHKRRYGYFPQQFTWRGRCYDVHAVERCWTVSRQRLGHKVQRLCFRVRGAAMQGRDERASQAVLEGTFDVYQDLNTNTWHLEKAVPRV